MRSRGCLGSTDWLYRRGEHRPSVAGPVRDEWSNDRCESPRYISSWRAFSSTVILSRKSCTRASTGCAACLYRAMSGISACCCAHPTPARPIQTVATAKLRESRKHFYRNFIGIQSFCQRSSWKCATFSERCANLSINGMVRRLQLTSGEV